MYASIEADREFARNVGRDDPDRAWILAPSDCWYPNPFYHGRAAAHPEDDSQEVFEAACDTHQDAIEARQGPLYRFHDDDIPY